MRKTLFVLSILATLQLGAAAFASVNDNQVTSQKIAEADGTSGQNTNSGSGVKTGHIQDGAVTDVKIGGTISQSKVTGLEAVLAGKSDVTHYHDTLYQQKYGKVAVVAQTGGDYTSPVDAMGAVATWCGTPSATNPCLLKIMPGIYNIGSQTVVMSQFVDIEGSGENITKIKGNVDGYNNGAIAGASNAELKSLSVENTAVNCSIAIYNSNASLKMTNLTAIATAKEAYAIYNWNAPEAVITNSTALANAMDQGRAYAVYNLNSPTKMNGVTAISKKAGGQNGGETIGIANDNSSVTLVNVTASGTGGAAGYGINNGYNSHSTMTNVSATGGGYNNSYGINNYDSAPTMVNVMAVTLPANTMAGISYSGTGATVPVAKIEHSAVNSGGISLRVDSGLTVYVSNSRLEAGSIQNSGTLKCIGLYDGYFDPIVCQ